MEFASKGRKTSSNSANSLVGNVLKLNTKTGQVTLSQDLLNALGWTAKTKINFAWDSNEERGFPFYLTQDDRGYGMSDKLITLAKSAITNQFVKAFPKMKDVNILCAVSVSHPIVVNDHKLYGVKFGEIETEETQPTQESNGHGQHQAASNGGSSGVTFP